MKIQQAALVATLAAAGSAQLSLGPWFTTNATANVTDIPDTLWDSPPYYPSPQGGRTQDEQWAVAYEKARAFVSKLSLVEKVNLTTGIGNAGACVGMTGDIPSQDFQGICFQDGPLGVRPTDMITGYPANIAAGATFNKRLVHARGRAIASEFKGKGIDVGLGPVVGPLGFYPSSGRQWEGFGADPYLAGVLGAEAVEGMQEVGVMANAKHFVLNEQETYRKDINEPLNDRALHEIYVWPFANLIRAGVGSVMCSYNLLNGTFGCENSYTLNHVLKDELGFQGFVVSDWDGTHSGIRAATAGLDMNMPGEAEHFASNLTAAVFNGTVPMERLDDMATRVMAAFYKLNLDEVRPARGPPNYNTWTLATVAQQYPGVFYGPQTVVNKHVDVRTPFNYKAAYTTALESVVLLKNVNNTLPLMTQQKKPPAKISVVGAAARPATDGGQCTFFGCLVADGFTQLGWGSGATAYPYMIAPAEGITNRARTLDGVAID